MAEKLRQKLRGLLDQRFSRPESKYVALGRVRNSARGLDGGNGNADKFKGMALSSLGGLERDFDKMMASALATGPHTASILSSVFGLVPGLSGR